MVINNYPINEVVYQPGKIYYLEKNWKSLTEAILEKLKKYSENMHLNEEVIQIDETNVITTKNKYHFKKLIICADNNFKTVIMPVQLSNYLSMINSIPFVRLYTYHPTGHSINKMTIIPGPFQKVIPMTKHILMMAYADANNANILDKLINKENLDSNEILNMINNIFKTIFDVKEDQLCTDYFFCYWNHGIHYFYPMTDGIKKIFGNIIIAGEMNSDKQGWVEGALKSIDDTLL
jgi:hypothetical protein